MMARSSPPSTASTPALSRFNLSSGVRRITGVTHANNTVMRTVAARLGRVEHSINLDFIVPPAAPVTGEAREATECHRIVVFNGRQVAVVAGAVE
jgi:hypothetical protein